MSEGAPIGFIWWALPTLMRSRGVAIEHITGLTSLLVLPWALKFVWAPLVDILRHRWPLRYWILTSQALMGMTLLPLLFLNWEQQFPLVTLFLILHSFLAATQDVSIDALCILVTGAHERGSLNGWMQAGMLTSRSLLGGGALILLKSIGLGGVLALLLAVVWGSSLFILASREPEGLSGNASGSPSFLQNLRATVRFKATWFGLLFAAVGGAGYEAVGAVAGPFMIDKGFSSEQVGWFFLIPAIVSTIAGSVLGGMIADRMRRLFSVRLFLTTMAASVLLMAGLQTLNLSPAHPLYVVGLTVLYFCIGLFVASTYALFMDLTNPELGATQFSTYMGATNFCESWSTFTVGRFVGAWGYAVAFLLMGLVSLSMMPIVGKLVPQHPPASTDGATSAS